MNRVSSFQHVILDFEDVDTVGQAFADEIFRVFSNRHPEIKLATENTTTDVEKMIHRATLAKIAGIEEMLEPIPER